MRTISVDVIRIPTKGPGDVSGLMQLIAAGKIKYREDHSAGSGAIPASFAEMLRGDSFGKMLVQLSPDPTLGRA